MELKVFGKTGRSVTEIGMGTYYDFSWVLPARLGWKRGAARKVEAMKTGLAGGISMIDTAEVYSSEPLVAEAIQGYRREDLFIATKATLTHLRRKAMFRALESSLRRLKTSYVDLYQVHQPNPIVPIRETMGAMEELLEAGKIRAIGVSNFSLKRMMDANASLKKARLASTQMSYSLLHRGIEKDVIPYCRQEGIAVLAYFPLGHGRLAGEKQRLRIFCEKYSKSPAQVALNWLASQPNVFPIPRAGNPAHVKENLEASGWRLSAQDLQELDRIFPGPAQNSTA
ncbi:MAG: aldo/keto reductase [Nitrososphaerales archaeon]|jgi:diketogulonate reductase-like aldo/keto reductase